MASTIAEFFAIIGVDITPPSTLGELIPYLLTVFVGVCLVQMVFHVIEGITCTVINTIKKV